MEHSRLVLPARQGAEEPPSSELTPDVVQFDNVQVQASPEPAGGFLTAQHRALQRSSNADCVINRYSLGATGKKRRYITNALYSSMLAPHAHKSIGPKLPHYPSM